MNLPRMLVLPAAALTGATLLAGCGGADLPSASQAQTAACRSYVLNVGHSDIAAGKTAMDEAGVGFDADGIHTALVPVRAAAVSAGTTPGLAEDDFVRFRAVVDSIDAIDSAVKVLDDGSNVVSAATVAKLQAAVTAVHRRCS